MEFRYVLVLFLLLLTPFVIFISLNRDLAANITNRGWRNIARATIAIMVGGTFGIASRYLAPLPNQDWLLQTGVAVAAVLLSSLAFSTATRLMMRKRHSLLFANFWMFLWATSAFMITRLCF